MKNSILAVLILMLGSWAAHGGYWSDEFWTELQNKRGPLEPIYFDFDDYSMPTIERTTTLELNATRIKIRLQEAGINAILVIEGHSCSFCKNEKYNQKIAELRAQEAKRLLVIRGIPKHRIKTIGKGNSGPKILTGDRAQQAPNRRVEFYLRRNK